MFLFGAIVAGIVAFRFTTWWLGILTPAAIYLLGYICRRDPDRPFAWFRYLWGFHVYDAWTEDKTEVRLCDSPARSDD
jgi:hypothetical protein